MNEVKLNERGLLELMESAVCRADALVCSTRLNIESTAYTLYMAEMGYTLDTARYLLAEAMQYHAELKKLVNKEAEQ
jgi:hypothetical protein